ncbi:MAG: sulfite oxidase [Nitrospiraceae bacterium]|nr:sulfite oxidase [Nitrospiraceae bacterium]
MTLSRREWFERTLQGLALALAGGGLSGRTRAEAASAATGPLITRVTRPFDAETPVQEFASWLTPNERLFVRSHFGPPNPEAVDPATWRLTVGGRVETPLTLTLDEIKRDFEAVSITAVLQCSGNGRAFHRPKVPGVQWERGAVGNVQWTGVRLTDLLQRAKLKGQALHVQLQGADRPALSTVPLFVRSIPLEKAMHPDTLLAYEMNGRPLPLLHGAPMRVITPGWMAESCIKWLTEITVQSAEASGYYMQTAYRIPVTAVQPNSGLPGTTMMPVEAMPVKSLIAAPAEGATVGRGPVTIQGVAWAGDVTVEKVEVSVDDGKTWDLARLVGNEQRYAWRQWQYLWTPKAPGAAAILCRATDARGETQPASTAWNPSGFLWNGWDRVMVTVA